MQSTQSGVGVGTGCRARAEAIARALVELTLKGRQLLPKSGNNRHPIAPSDPAAADIRRDMNNGDSREWFRLYVVGACDITDLVPVDVVTAAARQFIAEMEMLAAERDRSRKPGDFLRPMSVVIAPVFKAEHRLALDALKCTESPESIAVLQEFEADVDRTLAPLLGARADVERRIAIARGGQTRPVVGRRSGALSLA